MSEAQAAKKKVQVTLLKEHTHRNLLRVPGAVIELWPEQAQALIKQEVAVPGTTLPASKA